MRIVKVMALLVFMVLAVSLDESGLRRGQRSVVELGSKVELMVRRKRVEYRDGVERILSRESPSFYGL